MLGVISGHFVRFHNPRISLDEARPHSFSAPERIFVAEHVSNNAGRARVVSLFPSQTPAAPAGARDVEAGGGRETSVGMCALHM